jgi:hypothetical protein
VRLDRVSRAMPDGRLLHPLPDLGRKRAGRAAELLPAIADSLEQPLALSPTRLSLSSVGFLLGRFLKRSIERRA